jgi:hypothetical protein
MAKVEVPVDTTEVSPITVPTVPEPSGLAFEGATSESSAEPAPSQQITPVATSQRSVLAELFLWVDAAFEGRRMRVVLVLAAFVAIIAPMLDRATLDMRRLSALKSTMKEISKSDIAGFDFFSFLALLLLTGIGGAMLFGRVAALSTPDEGEVNRDNFGRTLRSLYRMIRSEWVLFWRLPIGDRLGLSLFLSYTSLQATKSVLSLFRWLAWKIIIEPFDLKKAWPGRWLENLYYFEGYLAVGAVLALAIASFAALVWALRRPMSTANALSEGTVRELQALRAEDPLINLVDLGRVHEVGDAFHGALVPTLLTHLHHWKPSTSANWEEEVRDELAAHLREQGLEVQVERHLITAKGRRRVDVVVADCIAVELKFRMHEGPQGSLDRARSQIHDYAEAWTRGPVFAFLIATPHIGKGPTQLGEVARRWNHGLEANRAPLLVLTHSGHLQAELPPA